MNLMSHEYTVEINGDATGKAPADIELIPREGTITGRDGRIFLHDQPGNIIKEFNQGKVDLPIDLEHSTQLKAPNGEPALAVGWIKKLTMNPYGTVWAAIEWNQKGRGLIEAKAYRYISPVFAIESGTKRIVKLISAGLTNKPNLFIGHLNQLGIANAEARNKAKYYLDYHGGGSEANIPDAKKGEYTRLKQDAEAKSGPYQAARIKDEALRTELADSKSELKNIGRQAAAEDVLRLQAKVDGIVFQISEYKRVIALEEDKIAQGNVDSKQLDLLHLKRSDLMADRALGKTVEQASLDEIEAQILEEERIIQAKTVGSSAEIIIGGLKRKINDAEQILAPMKSDLQTIYCDYLIAEAEKTGTEFVELAAKLWEKHLRVLALGKIIEQQPSANGISIATSDCMKFKIPAFNLKSCLEGGNQSRWLPQHTEEAYPDITAAVDSVKNDIGALGITCL